MKDNLIPIGKMAAMNRVSVPTLRLYDEKGLLKPRYVDPETGYRYYDIDQNARLDMIAYMKELGMSLAQIAQVLQKEDISLIEELLSQKNEQIHEQMRQLKAQHDAVERAILSIERYRKSPATGTLSLEYIDRRFAWGIPCAYNFYQDDVHSYEQSLRALRLKLEEKGFQQIHSYNIGTRATSRPCRWSRAACTPASTSTTTTTRCAARASSEAIARTWATTWPATISARS